MIDGFTYIANFVSPAEERELLESIQAAPFAALQMRGQQTRRTIVSYGLEFRPHVGRLAAGFSKVKISPDSRMA